MERTILHVDCNSFYASVECFLNPNIRKYPVAVCGDVENRHGIILAKNEYAKKFSVTTGDTVWEAQENAPALSASQPILTVISVFLVWHGQFMRTIPTVLSLLA